MDPKDDISVDSFRFRSSDIVVQINGNTDSSSTWSNSTEKRKLSKKYVLEARASYFSVRTSIESRLRQIPSCVNHSSSPVDDVSPQDVENMIDLVLCKAQHLINSDPRGFFFYKFPKQLPNNDPKLSLLPSILLMPGDKITPQSWATIGNFTIDRIICNIRDYIASWNLLPNTKCIVLSNNLLESVDERGMRCYVVAHFSKPTPDCPNPLAVVKVNFVVTVPRYLPPYYPVMVTYHFETHKVLFYAFGEQAINSISLQSFYIEAILETKLAFYAALCKCQYGTLEKPKPTRREEKHRDREKQKTAQSTSDKGKFQEPMSEDSI